MGRKLRREESESACQREGGREGGRERGREGGTLNVQTTNWQEEEDRSFICD